MSLRGVIFDMGGTLLDYHPPDAPPQHGWREMENIGASALYRYLQERNYALPALDAARELSFQIVEREWRQISQDETANPQLGLILYEVMRVWGIPEEDLQNGLVDNAMAAYVAPVQAFVRPMAGAQETLAALQASGFRIGLVSNTVWPGAFHVEDLSRWGLTPYLECTLFSADVAAWKPSATIFQMALDALNLRADEAVYVGDHPYFDVYGAQQAGLRGVWMWTEEWKNLQPGNLKITPDATIKRLPDLVEIVQSWR